jgi:hypothetical protein
MCVGTNTCIRSHVPSRNGQITDSVVTPELWVFSTELPSYYLEFGSGCQIFGKCEDPVLWNPSAYYHGHRTLPLVPVLIQINPFHAIPSFFLTSSFYSPFMLGLTSDSFPSGSHTMTLNAFLFTPCVPHALPI